MSAALAAGTIVIVSLFRPGAETGIGSISGVLGVASHPIEISRLVMNRFDDLVRGLPEMLAPQFPIAITAHIVGARATGFDATTIVFKRVTRRAAAVEIIRSVLPRFIQHAAEEAIRDKVHELVPVH